MTAAASRSSRPGRWRSSNAGLPPTWSHGNPVDIIGDADGPRYAAALDVLSGAPGVDAILVLNCPTAVASGLDAAEAVVEDGEGPDRAVLTNWLGADVAEESRKLFSAASLPTYDTPEKAVRGFMHLVRYARGQETLMEVPPSIPASFTPDEAGARAIVAEALKAGESWLSEPRVRLAHLLRHSRRRAPRLCARREEAAARQREFGGPVALKIFSPDITHKSDVGGVALDLAVPTSCAHAEAMLARVAKPRPRRGSRALSCRR
jgi:acetyltransferase